MRVDTLSIKEEEWSIDRRYIFKVTLRKSLSEKKL